MEIGFCGELVIIKQSECVMTFALLFLIGF